MCTVTCSGTIGKVMIVPRHWEGCTLNQHVMRIKPTSDNVAGYIYAWLDSPYAKPLIVRNTYGTVVDEIDDNQLSTVAIPLLNNKKSMILFLRQKSCNIRRTSKNRKRSTK